MTGKNANMHKLWIRNTNKDNKVYDEDKEWQIVTRSVVSKSITGYNFAAKHGALTNSGHNELAISRTESPDMNKNEFNPCLDALKKKDGNSAIIDNIFGISVKNSQHPEYKTYIRKIKSGRRNTIKTMEELRRQLEEAKQQLQEITVHIDLQSEKNDESQSNERWAFPKLRSIAWNMMKFGIPTLIIFSIFFVMIWYMMTQYSSA